MGAYGLRTEGSSRAYAHNAYASCIHIAHICGGHAYAMRIGGRGVKIRDFMRTYCTDERDLSFRAVSERPSVPQLAASLITVMAELGLSERPLINIITTITTTSSSSSIRVQAFCPVHIHPTGFIPVSLYSS